MKTASTKKMMTPTGKLKGVDARGRRSAETRLEGDQQGKRKYKTDECGANCSLDTHQQNLARRGADHQR